MRLTTDTFEVSEDFVRWALELAFKKVYENRRDHYKDSSDLVKDAIEFRMDCMNDFIDNFLEIGCFSIDPYDEIDSRFWADEKSYEQIWTEEIYPKLDEDDQKELWEVYEEKTSQDDLIYKRCDENDYWYDNYDSLAVQNCFNYSY
jgi:hypothetical protein